MIVTNREIEAALDFRRQELSKYDLPLVPGCQRCGGSPSEDHWHHIVPVSLCHRLNIRSNTPDNLIRLCIDCHEEWHKWWDEGNDPAAIQKLFHLWLNNVPPPSYFRYLSRTFLKEIAEDRDILQEDIQFSELVSSWIAIRTSRGQI